MEAFSALLSLCEGNPSVTDRFPSQRPVTGSFDVFFDLRLNNRLSKQSGRLWFETPSRSLWRHCNRIVTYKNLTDSESQLYLLLVLFDAHIVCGTEAVCRAEFLCRQSSSPHFWQPSSPRLSPPCTPYWFKVSSHFNKIFPRNCARNSLRVQFFRYHENTLPRQRQRHEQHAASWINVEYQIKTQTPTGNWCCLFVAPSTTGVMPDTQNCGCTCTGKRSHSQSNTLGIHFTEGLWNHNWNIVEFVCVCESRYLGPIRSLFLVCQDSWAVVTWTKLWVDMNIVFEAQLWEFWKKKLLTA